jgi:hypothetical protein
MISVLSDTDLEIVTGGSRGIDIDIKHSFNTGGTSVGDVKVSSYKAGGNTVLIGSSGGLNVNVLFG